MTFASAFDRWGGFHAGRLQSRQGVYLVLGWFQAVACSGNLMTTVVSLRLELQRLKFSRNIIQREKPLLYLAGAYTGAIEKNIVLARAIAVELWEKGYACLTPHLNTAHFEQDCKATYEDYMAGDLVMVERADAIVMLPGWEQSRGARRELIHAGQMGVPVYEYPQLPPLPQKQVQ